MLATVDIYVLSCGDLRRSRMNREACLILMGSYTMVGFFL